MRFKLALLTCCLALGFVYPTHAQESPPTGFRIKLGPRLDANAPKPSSARKQKTTRAAQKDSDKQKGPQSDSQDTEKSRSPDAPKKTNPIGSKIRTTEKPAVGTGSSSQTEEEKTKRVVKKKKKKKRAAKKKKKKKRAAKKKKKKKKRAAKKKKKKRAAKKTKKKRTVAKKKKERDSIPKKRRENFRGEGPSSPRLQGTKTQYGFETRWGQVDAVAPDVAARIRQLIDGTETVFDQTVSFEKKGIGLTGSSALVLAALSDYLKVSEEIILVMLEGYSTDFDDPTENQRLSQARASAVREFLSGKGISGDRLISYGLGERRPSTLSKSLVIRLISGTPANRPAATHWDKIGLVQVSGDVSIGKTDSGHSELPARARAEFKAPFSTQTGDTGQTFMRFPDSSQIRLGPNSRLNIDTARYSTSPRALNLRLPLGMAEIISDPTKSTGVALSIKVGSIFVSGGSMRLRVESREEYAWVAVDRGMATVKTMDGLTLQVGPGQTFLVSQGNPPGIWPHLQAPHQLTLASNAEDNFELSWTVTPNATAYRVEMSDSAEFTTIRRQQVSVTPKLTIQPQDGLKYWRVTALDERGLAGRRSSVYPLERARSAAPDTQVH